MDVNMLSDLLVRLASLGASGVCIFAIFWTGWLITRIPPQADPERHRTVRFFMVTCVFIALVSAGSGIMNAMYNQEQVAQEKGEKKQVQASLDSTKQQLLATKATSAKAMQYVLNSVDQVKREQLIKKAPAEVKSNIRLHLDPALISRLKPAPIQPKPADKDK